MGFFGSLIRDAIEVIGVITSNAGAIEDAAKAVGTVAGLIVGVFDANSNPLEPDSGDALIDLHNDYGRATDYITSLAEKINYGAKTRPADHLFVRKATTNGLWLYPSTTVDGRPCEPMYQDLSTFLAFNKFPLTLQGSSNTPVDAAEYLAAALFANAPMPFAKWTQLNADGSQPVFTGNALQAELESPAGDCKLIAKHVYYDVPLGEVAESSCWHGAVHVEMTSTEEFFENHMSEIAHRAVLGRKLTTAGKANIPSWLVTMQISWSSNETAKNVTTKLNQSWPQQNPNYEVLLNSVLGTIQTVKIMAPQNVTPATTRQMVSNFCLEHMSNGPKGTLPNIVVTNSSISF